MGRLRTLAKKCRGAGKEASDDPDAPAVDEDGGYADWVKIGLLLKEEIDKRLRKLEDYLNEMSAFSVCLD
jgi:IS5 family transposase